MNRIINQDQILGGVCLGLAEHFKTQVSLIRAIAIILIFTPIPVITAYIILWIILPVKYGYLTPSTEEQNLNIESEMSNQSKNGNLTGGLILILLGAIFSFKTFFDINLFSYLKYIWNLWPLVLIALGVWIIVKEKNDNNNGPHNGTYNNNFNDGSGYNNTNSGGNFNGTSY